MPKRTKKSEVSQADKLILCRECGGDHVSLTGVSSSFAARPEERGLMVTVRYVCLDCFMRYSEIYAPSGKKKLMRIVIKEYSLEHKWAKEELE